MSETPTNLGYTLEDARRHGFDLLALYELWHWNSCFPMSVNHDLIRDATRAVQRELEERYVELPRDANGKVFRVGCEVKPVKRETELAYTVYSMTYGKDGWKIYVSGDRHAIEREPSFFEVCEPPTVEDEIRSIVQLCFNIKERGERWSVDDVMQSGNVSDVVAKLRLKEER